MIPDLNKASGPRSKCSCGHTGDGPNSQHASLRVGGLYELGAGECMVKGCPCNRFTWVSWRDEFIERHPGVK